MFVRDQVTASFGEAVCHASSVHRKSRFRQVVARMGSTGCSDQASSSNRPSGAVASYLA